MVIKIMPESVESFEEMKGSVLKEIKTTGHQEEPLAFGLKALRISLIMDDGPGSSEIDEKIKKIKGVGEVEVEQVSRI